MATENPSPTKRPAARPHWGWALAALAGGLLVLLWSGWSAGYLGDSPWAALYRLALAAWLNLSLLAAALWGWQKLGRGRGQGEALRRELRHLRSWGGEEGRLRKEGLIRDLNALGERPEGLDHAVLTGADLKGADLAGCDLTDADLREADLQGARMEGACLWGADLSAANLTMAALAGADLRGANLDNAELVKADLAAANLHRATLVNANLYGTDLRPAKLQQTRFASGGDAAFPGRIHSSVEDWIRAGLDAEGFYSPEEPQANAGQRPKGGGKAGQGA